MVYENLNDDQSRPLNHNYTTMKPMAVMNMMDMLVYSSNPSTQQHPLSYFL